MTREKNAPIRSDSRDSLRVYVFQDSRANSKNVKFRVFMVLFRFFQYAYARAASCTLIALLIDAVYRCISETIFGLELPLKVRVGPGLRIYHGFGLVVNDATIIGRDVVLRNGVVIGHRRSGGPVPRLADGVEVGATACILGGVHIGRGARIAAGAVVLRDVPADGLAIGNPARVAGTAR